MKLKPFALGLAGGVFWGAMMFLTTWLSIFTGGYAREFLLVFTGIYPGYSITPVGSFLALPYGFVDGFILGAAVGWLYNRFSG